MPPISACIITKNESQNLESCLRALDFVDEIVLLDSGSTDNTIEIARSFSARISYRDFDEYSHQKNFALSLAKNNWILSIDADEIVSDSLKQEILSLPEEVWKDSVGFSIPRLSFYLGKWIYHGGWYPNRQIRLFQKSHGKFKGSLHEKVHLDTKPRLLKNPIQHFTYKNISDHLRFIDRYSSLFAQDRHQKGKRSSVFQALYKASFKFLWMYVGRLGFLDGRAGVVLAVLGFYYNFLKYIKIVELQEKGVSVSPFLVVVDLVHDVERQKTTHKDGDQVHIG